MERDAGDTYNRTEYERLTRELHEGQRDLLPRRTVRQIVKDEWITALVVLVIFVIPMLLALKGAIL